MSKSIKVRKGLDIRLKGEAEKVKVDAPNASLYALKPTDFHGVVPKMVTKVGDSIKVGTPVFQDKYTEDIKYVSPVSGKVAEIRRGAKRRILEVILESDGNFTAEEKGAQNLESLDRQGVKDMLLANGLWPGIKMRPLDVVANPQETPKSIFISSFDSSPLAADFDFIAHGQDAEFQTGVQALKKLTDGAVNLQVRGKGADAAFTKVKGASVNKVSGPHPAGNVGPQIHQIDPINKGEVVWVVKPQDVIAIGRFVMTGKYDSTRIVALTGTQASNRKYFKTVLGAQISSITEGNVSGDNMRVVSGNPLTGETVGADGFLGFYDSQITCLPEGDRYKFFLTEGWLSPGFGRFSASRAYPSFMMPGKKYDIDTNLGGEERAFVVSEQYEQVFPFDIYPVHLIKSIIINDIDSMEKLGIYEVAPEDFALCEFVCTSKINSQSIVRDGLDVIKKECM